MQIEYRLTQAAENRSCISFKSIIAFVYIYMHFRYTVTKLCNRVGLRLSSVSKQSKHLDYDHPSMAMVRDFVATCAEMHQIEPRLIANFDQVWSVHYEPPRRVVHKHDSQRGVLQDPMARKRSLQTILCQIRKSLGIDMGEDQTKTVCTPVQLNASGNMNPVDYARCARTCTTLSWRDGELGRAWITIQPGSM